MSCSSDDFSDLEQTIAEIKARPKVAIDPLPPVVIAEPFLFDLDGSRDPFKPVEREEPSSSEGIGNGIQPDPDRPKEDLESYALDTLRMVGTLKDSTLWALVLSTNNGTIYRVKEGNYMGLHDGKITEISDTDIKLMEIVPDKNPKTWREQPAALKLVN
jgi:type IV pilus assembly protein PilP